MRMLSEEASRCVSYCYHGSTGTQLCQVGTVPVPVPGPVPVDRSVLHVLLLLLYDLQAVVLLLPRALSPGATFRGSALAPSLRTIFNAYSCVQGRNVNVRVTQSNRRPARRFVWVPRDARRSMHLASSPGCTVEGDRTDRDRENHAGRSKKSRGHRGRAENIIP